MIYGGEGSSSFKRMYTATDVRNKTQNQLQHEGKQSSFLERRFDTDLADIEAEVDEWIEQSDSSM